MAAVTICSDFGAQKNKVWHCLHCFPIYFPWSDGTGCHDFIFWMLGFKPTFSLSTLTFIKRLLSSSSLSAKVNINALPSPTAKIYHIYTCFLNCYHHYHYSLASHFFWQLGWQIKCSSFRSSIISEVFLCTEIFSVSPLLVGLSQKAIARICGPAWLLLIF